MTKEELSSRGFLFVLASEAAKRAEVTPNPSWKRAYLALSDAADRLDAMIARNIVHEDE